MATHNIILSSLIETEVRDNAGDSVAVIEELVIDRVTGIIRFIIIKVNESTADNITKNKSTANNSAAKNPLSVCLPWSAMVLNKSRNAFTLTHAGQAMMKEQ